MKGFKLLEFEYSPGYCDMLGAGHRSELKRDGDGNWFVECRDREVHSSPTVVTRYEAAPDAVREFEKFIDKSRVASLSKRPKSDDFVTDYSPWSYYFEYEKTVLGKTVNERCGIYEYRKYSRSDFELIDELTRRFNALRGRVLSEQTED